MEAESCKAIYADLRPRGILARETIHNKLSAWENEVRATRFSFPAICPDPLPRAFACGRSFHAHDRPDKERVMSP